MGTHINFTKGTFSRFKKEYKKAVEEKKDTFIFDGNEFLVAYAKYVIEYLEMKFGKQ